MSLNQNHGVRQHSAHPAKEPLNEQMIGIPTHNNGAIVFDTVTLAELSRENLPEREYVLFPIIPVGGLAMVVAQRGIGKTHVGIGVAYAAACGSSFLRWKADKPRRVLYIDGEMPQQLIQQRIKSILGASASSPPEEKYFTFLPMDRQNLGLSINLASEEHQKALEPCLAGTDLVVIDNVSTLVSSGRENDADSWDAMQRWLLNLRRRGISVLLIHHAGRNDMARGTSKREDVLDTVIQLKRPENYKASEGARFEVHLSKARGAFGEDVEPFEAQLSEADGREFWNVKELIDDEEEAVAELTQQEQSCREIADTLGISKSKVSRIQKELRESGRL